MKIASVYGLNARTTYVFDNLEVGQKQAFPPSSWACPRFKGSATVYTAHKQEEDTKVETHLWVSKTNGLPLKQETEVGGKVYSTIRYEYTNVQVPPGVK